MSNAGALEGLTVLDLSRLLPGPYCSMILADHGARVIAVEDKKFLDDGLFLNLINRNKEHISLNLKTEEGKKIFFQLAKKADVLIEQFRPGVVERLGVDYESVKTINPEIVYCSITGYGQTGPYRDRAGHDVNYLSIAGVLGLIGEKGLPPSIAGVQVADIAGGGMSAAIGILLALQSREKTGKGQYIDISMTDAMANFLPIALFFQQLTGQFPERADGFLSHRYASYNTYETADGKYLSIGAVENRFWKVLCEKLDVPEYITLQYDEKRRQEILDFMRNAFKMKTLSEWEDILGEHDICWAPVKSVSEAIQDPQMRAREMFIDVDDGNGNQTTTIGVPIKLSRTPGSIRRMPDSFGHSTKSVLKEFGYTDEKIKILAEKGVI
ncbi:MAG: CoA transferase [Deltaproteobacteria bacterium]|nr:CoA transferase [Deltaproteobacteria bacterium]